MRAGAVTASLRNQNLAANEAGAGIASGRKWGNWIILGLDEEDGVLGLNAGELASELLLGIDLPGSALVEEGNEIVTAIFRDLLVDTKPLLKLGRSCVRHQIPIAAGNGVQGHRCLRLLVIHRVEIGLVGSLTRFDRPGLERASVILVALKSCCKFLPAGRSSQSLEEFASDLV